MFNDSTASATSLPLFGTTAEGSPMREPAGPTDTTTPAQPAPRERRARRGAGATDPASNVARLHPDLLQAMRNLDKGLDAISLAETLVDILQRTAAGEPQEDDLNHAMSAVHFILSRGRDEAFAAHEAICASFGMSYADLNRKSADET